MVNDLNIEVNTREVVERFGSDSQRIYFLFSASSLQSHERVNSNHNIYKNPHVPYYNSFER